MAALQNAVGSDLNMEVGTMQIESGHEALARVRAALIEAAPEPTGYRITHIFQVADEDTHFQYIERMDVDTWEHITPAIDVLMTRTRAEGWTVGITVAQLNLPRVE